MLENVIVWIATGFGLGYVPHLGGLFGALLGVPLAWWVAGRRVGVQVAVSAGLLMVGLSVSHVALEALGGGDPSQLVVDEALAFPLTLVGRRGARRWHVLGAAWGLYLVLDSVKPLPIFWIEGVGGAAGVVLDDVGAALLTWVLLAGGLAVWRRFGRADEGEKADVT